MGWKEALQITLFVLAWLPIGYLAMTTVISYDQPYDYDFSIYNTDWDGCSQFRVMIEQNGYQVQSIQSAMSVINRYDGNATLVILGPVRDFSFDATLTILQHMMAGGGVIIADDFGTTNSSFVLLNDLLLDMLAGDSPLLEYIDGFVAFADGILMDLDSYYESPRLPVIRDFNAHPLFNGVSTITLNNATAITPRSILGATGIAWTTTRAWVESEVNKTNPTPSEGEYAGRLPVIGVLDSRYGIPIEGRMVAISDPSIFINEMWNEFEGNSRFGENLINWISLGNTDHPIIFCEQLLATPLFSAEFFFGGYMSRMLWASTNFFLAPIYPLMTAVGIKKYLPDMKKPEVKSVSEVFMRRGQTYFSERMTYYRTEGNYARVIKMIYRKLRRGLKKKYQWSDYKSERVWDLVRYKDSSIKEADFFKTIQRIEEIASKPNMKIRESEMMKLFFWMKNIQDRLVET